MHQSFISTPSDCFVPNGRARTSAQNVSNEPS